MKCLRQVRCFFFGLLVPWQCSFTCAWFEASRGTGTALVEELDKLLMVQLRDGRKILGILRCAAALHLVFAAAYHLKFCAHAACVLLWHLNKHPLPGNTAMV